jgi:glycosyltransferase involved in cell wall biosynthesis
MRVLAVGNMYPPQHAGGYELAWQQAMRHARAAGHRVRVLTSDYVEDPHRPEEDPDVHRALRWYWDLERYEFPKLNLLEQLRLERHNARELRRHLQAFAPDVVAWWSMGCMSMSLIERVRVAGIPAVFVVHDDWLAYGWEHDQWMRTWSGPRRQAVGQVVGRVCGVPVSADLGRAGSFVFNSSYTLERARQTGLAPPAMTIVHPGIEDRFLQGLAPEPWGWRLAYIGRIDRQKGIDTAVAALAHLPREATLTVWGTGDARYIEELRQLAAAVGAAGRVRFEGFASDDRLNSAYARADAVVFPVRWNEPFGLVPLEAMGMGRPVVTTSRGGTAEFVRDAVNALVFEAGDARALAGCVERLAEDEPLRARLREEGQRTAARYSVMEFAERTLQETVRAAETPQPVGGIAVGA